MPVSIGVSCWSRVEYACEGMGICNVHYIACSNHECCIEHNGVLYFCDSIPSLTILASTGLLDKHDDTLVPPFWCSSSSQQLLLEFPPILTMTFVKQQEVKLNTGVLVVAARAASDLLEGKEHKVNMHS